MDRVGSVAPTSKLVRGKTYSEEFVSWDVNFKLIEEF